MRKIFQNAFAKRVQTFCAFCRVPRKVYKKRRIGLGDIIACAMAAALATALYFQGLDAKGIFFFVGFLFVSETFIQLRWRLGVVCPHCGFDPVVYVKDPGKAAERVKAHLDKRQDDPARLLGPAMHIPSRRAPPPERKKGQRISKQV